MENAKKFHAMLEVNRVASEIVTNLLPKLESLKGQKILKTDGSILAKYAELLKIDKIEVKKYKGEYASMHYGYLECTGDSIWLKISLCFKADEHSCFYESKSIYLGSFETVNFNSNGVLKDVNADIEYLSKKTTIEEQESYLKEHGELSRKLQALEAKIWLKDELKYTYLRK